MHSMYTIQHIIVTSLHEEVQIALMETAASAFSKEHSDLTRCEKTLPIAVH